MRALRHVARSDVSSDRGLAWASSRSAFRSNFGLAGTIVQERAPAPSPRPHFGDLRPELLWPDADRRTCGHQPFRPGRHAHRAWRSRPLIYGVGALFVLSAVRALVPIVRRAGRGPASRNRQPSISDLGVRCYDFLFHLLEFRPPHRLARKCCGRSKASSASSHIELGHGIRISLMPGIQKMYRSRRGHVQQPAQFLSAAGGGDARFARLLQIFRRHISANASAR